MSANRRELFQSSGHSLQVLSGLWEFQLQGLYNGEILRKWTGSWCVADCDGRPARGLWAQRPAQVIHTRGGFWISRQIGGVSTQVGQRRRALQRVLSGKNFCFYSDIKFLKFVFFSNFAQWRKPLFQISNLHWSSSVLRHESCKFAIVRLGICADWLLCSAERKYIRHFQNQ